MTLQWKVFKGKNEPQTCREDVNNQSKVTDAEREQLRPQASLVQADTESLFQLVLKVQTI